jgi:fibronectin type 3 domain-containing protein
VTNTDRQEARTKVRPLRCFAACSLIAIICGCDLLNRTGSLAAESLPPGALINVDGVDTGYLTPHTFDDLQTGVHTVELSLAGYAPWGPTPVQIITDQTTKITAAFQFATGLLPLPNDIYANLPVSVPSGDVGNLPIGADLSANMPEPGFQGFTQGSCVGWATAYAIKTYHERLERDWSLTDQSHLMSPAFIYNQIKQDNCESGAFIIDGLNLLQGIGCATLESMPYDPNDCSDIPGASVLEEAQLYRIRDWSRVDQGSQSIVKGFLANNGQPVVVALKVFWDLQLLNSQNEVYDDINGDYLGSQAVVLVGYSDSIGAFKFINSWGTGWGDGGYGWLSYDIFLSVVTEAYVAHDAISGAPEMNVLHTTYAIPDGTGNYDFGTVAAGASRSVTFTIENLGDADLELNGSPRVEISGTDLAAFSVTTQPSSPVAANGSVSFQLAFDPSSTGSKSATISIVSNDTDESPYDFTATGICASQPAPDINVTQGSTDIPDGIGSFDFGTVTAGASQSVTFTIENLGDADLELNGSPRVAISGTDLAAFSVTTQPDSPVAENASVSFQLAFDPSSTGSKSATITIVSNDIDESPYDFALVGTTPPTAPANVAAGDGLSVLHTRIEWDIVTGASHYRVFRNSSDDSVGSSAISSWQTISFFEDVTADSGSSYYYWVRAATDYAGNLFSDLGGPDIGWRSIPAPDNVGATDGIFASSITVTWDSAAGASHYQVFRDTASDVSTSIPVSGWQTSRSFLDTAVTPATTYFYWVRAAASISGEKASAMSSSDEGWIGLNPPPGVTATDGTSVSAVSINWDTVSGANYYRVYRNASSNSSGAVAITSWTTAAEYYDSTATAGITYYYWVKAAIDGSGTRPSGYSGSDSGWRELGPPSGVTATDGTSVSAVSIDWDTVSGANYYCVYRNTSSSSSGAVAITSWTTAAEYYDSTATAGITYYYWVKTAIDGSGTRPSSYSGSDSGWRELGPPSGVTATDGTSVSHVSIDWDTVSGANYYRVYRNTSSSSSGAAAITSWTNATAYDDSTAIAGTTYYYWVKAAIDTSGTRSSDFGSSNTGKRLVYLEFDFNATGITLDTNYSEFYDVEFWLDDGSGELGERSWHGKSFAGLVMWTPLGNDDNWLWPSKPGGSGLQVDPNCTSVRVEIRATLESATGSGGLSALTNRLSTKIPFSVGDSIWYVDSVSLGQSFIHDSPTYTRFMVRYDDTGGTLWEYGTVLDLVRFEFYGW